MPTLAIDKRFLKDLGTLEKPVYNRVTEIFGEFDAAHRCSRNLGPAHSGRINGTQASRAASIATTAN